MKKLLDNPLPTLFDPENDGDGLNTVLSTPVLDEFEDDEVAVVIATIREHIGKKE